MGHSSLLRLTALFPLCGALAAAQDPYADPLVDRVVTPLRHVPRGALAAAAQNRSYQDGDRYYFEYGDATSTPGKHVRYEIDMSHPDVVAGMIHVRETVQDILPVTKAGLAWRTAGGPNEWDPPCVHAAACTTTLVHEYFDEHSGVLTLRYRESRGGVDAEKSYRFWIEGQALRIRVRADRSVNESYVNNYALLHCGRTERTRRVRQHTIPYMENVTVLAFSDAITDEPAFVGLMTDWYKSSGGGSTQIREGTEGALCAGGGDSISHFTTSQTDRAAGTGGGTIDRVLVPVDETFSVIVTDEVADTFPSIPHHRSPYYHAAGGRTNVYAGADGPDTYSRYERQYDHFADWGLRDLVVHQAQTRSFGISDLLVAEGGAVNVLGVDAAFLQAQTFALAAYSQILPDPASGQYACLAGQSSTIYWADPDDPLFRNAADDAFRELNFAARRSGGLFAHQVAHAHVDQRGSGDYAGGSPPQDAFAPGVPGHIPLQMPTWQRLNPNCGNPANPVWTRNFGLVVPQSSPTYDSIMDWTCIGPDGNREVTQDLQQRLLRSSWHMFNPINPPYDPTDKDQVRAYPTHEVDANYYEDYLQIRLGHGLVNYWPNSILFDADHVVPNDFKIDNVALDDIRSDEVNNPKARTIAQVIDERVEAVRNLRDVVEGPLFGEAAATAPRQAFEHGSRDGVRWRFISDQPALPGADLAQNNKDSWVVPDFNLLEVVKKASGHAGMGWESDHDGELTPPFDCAGALGDPCLTRDTTFLDSWVTTIATYGNNPLFSTNGDQLGTQWTYEGLINQYAALTGLARIVRESPVQSIQYSDGTVTGSLSEILDPTLDEHVQESLLKQSRIKIQYQTGLNIQANHGSSNWTVAAGGSSVVLAPNGFAAEHTGLLVLYNCSTDGGTSFFDYARYDGHYEMIAHRNGASRPSHDGFPTGAIESRVTALSADALADVGLIFHDQWDDVLVVADRGLWNDNLTGSPDWEPNAGSVAWEVGAPSNDCPTLELGLEGHVTGMPSMTQGIPMGLSATLIRGGAERDVTTLPGPNLTPTPAVPFEETITWEVVSGNATINSMGVLDPTGSGAITVRATYQGPQASCPPSGVQDDLLILVAPSALVATATFTSEGDVDLSATGGTSGVALGEAVHWTAASQAASRGNVSFLWSQAATDLAHEGAELSATVTRPSLKDFDLRLEDQLDSVDSAIVGVAVSDVGSYLFADRFDDGDLLDWTASGSWGVLDGSAATAAAGPGDEWSLTSPSLSGDMLCFEAEVGFGTGEASLHLFKASPTDGLDDSGVEFRLYEDGAGVGRLEMLGPDVHQIYDWALPLYQSGSPVSVQVISRNEPVMVQGQPVDQVKLRISVNSRFVAGQALLKKGFLPPTSHHFALVSSNADARFDDVKLSPGDSPHANVSRVDLASGGNTILEFAADDFDGSAQLEQADFELIVRTFDASGALTSITSEVGLPFTGTIVSDVPRITGKVVSFELISTVESFAGPLDAAVEFELLAHGVAPASPGVAETARKRARYELP